MKKSENHQEGRSPAVLLPEQLQVVLGLAPSAGLFGKRQSQEDIFSLISYAVKTGGIRDLDTAPWYGCGKSEIDIGAALAKLASETATNGTTTCTTTTASLTEEILTMLLRNNSVDPYSSLDDDGSGTQIDPATLWVCQQQGVGEGSKTVPPPPPSASGVSRDGDNSKPPEQQTYPSSSPSSVHSGRGRTLPMGIRLSTKVGRILIPRNCCSSSANDDDRLDSKADSQIIGSIDEKGKETEAWKRFAMNPFIQSHPAPSTSPITIDQPSLPEYKSRLLSRLSTFLAVDAEHRKKQIDEATVAATSEGSQDNVIVEYPTAATLYYPHPETDDYVCINDYTYSGILHSFRQSYSRLYGDLHTCLGETIIADKDGFVQIIKEGDNTLADSTICRSSGGGALSPKWYVTDTLRLHDADTEEFYNEVTSEGGLVAMRHLQDRGYITHIGLGLNCVKFTKRYLEFSDDVLGNHPFSFAGESDDDTVTPSPLFSPNTARDSTLPFFGSMLLAGCWNLVDRTAQDHLGRTTPSSPSPTSAVVSPTSDSSTSPSTSSSPTSRKSRLFNAGIFASGLLWGGNNFRYFPASVDIRSKRDAYNAAAKRRFLPLMELASKNTDNKNSHLSPPLARACGLLAAIIERTPFLPLAALSCGFAKISPGSVVMASTVLEGGGENEEASTIVVGCASVSEIQGTLLALLLAPPLALIQEVEREVQNL